MASNRRRIKQASIIILIIVVGHHLTLGRSFQIILKGDQSLTRHNHREGRILLKIHILIILRNVNLPTVLIHDRVHHIITHNHNNKLHLNVAITRSHHPNDWNNMDNLHINLNAENPVTV